MVLSLSNLLITYLKVNGNKIQLARLISTSWRESFLGNSITP